MITLRKHISMLEYIGVKNNPQDFIETLNPLDRLDFIRSSSETYPIKDNIKSPVSVSSSKSIHTSVKDLVLGQFIMLEQIITGKTKLADHRVDLEIAKLIIRPSHHKVFDNESATDEYNNEKDILSYDVREVYYILDKFIEDRNTTLFKEFAGVFYDAVNEDEEEQEEEEKTSDMLFSQQWYWYSIVRMLGNEDVTKYEEIYMLPMSTVLPEMSYLAQRSKIESARERQNQAMSKL